jgi:phosphoglycolate phosphatase
MESDNQHSTVAHTAIAGIEAVIFDFDGTLAELHIDFGKMRSAVAHLMENYDLLPHDYDHLYILEMIDEASRRISEHYPERGVAFFDKAMEVIQNLEMEAAAKSSLFYGVKEMLSDLARWKIATGIITRNCYRALHTIFPDYRNYVTAVITREMTSYVKPDPRHLTEILSLINISAGQSLMVGDHPIDIRIGKDVGTYTAAVLTGTGKHEDLIISRPDFLLPGVLEIREILRTTNNETIIRHKNTTFR